MKRNIFIYVGAHKTGTTFLHRELVKLEAQLSALDCRYDPEGVKYAKALLARGHPIDPLTVAKLDHEIKLAHSSWKERNIILISEHFMGNPYTGYKDVETIAEALPGLFTDCKVHILLSTRRQDVFLESWYNQSIKEGGFWTFDEFIANTPYENLDWNRVAACYEDRFGRECVRVISYERAYKDPRLILDAHFKNWAYQGTLALPPKQPVNPSVSRQAIEMLRQANRFLDASSKSELRKIFETCSPKPPEEPLGLWSASERSRILGLFAPSNEALARRHPEAGTELYINPKIDQGADDRRPAAQEAVIESLGVQVLQKVFQYSRNSLDEATARVATYKQLEEDQRSTKSELEVKAKEIAALKNEIETKARHLGETEARLKKLSEDAKQAADAIYSRSRSAAAILVRKDLRVVRNQLRISLAEANPVKKKPKSAREGRPEPKKHQAIDKRHSNPAVDMAQPVMRAQVREWKHLPANQRTKQWRASRREVYVASGEYDRIHALKNKHAGRRCFIIGNGPSLNSQDLSKLKDEITFVSNWFVNAEQYSILCPKYYCVSSHEMFGGWNKPDPQLNPDYYAAMQAKARGATKFFSFAFRDYIKEAGLFPGEDVKYLLFERPKRLVDEAGKINLDLSRHLDDGYTVIQTMCIPLAVHMGCTEIYLLGCDCDYGIESPDDSKRYCYDAKLHKTSTSKFESLQRIWADNGPVFKSYEILRDTLAAKGVKLVNATNGGRLTVLPSARYENLVT
ncbi:MAG: hypothetical protein K0R17_2040 [Rariglobus sp.]|jgi:hypothetical protein|nr:hypothetical protein [Rariglobus sp.]